MKKVLLAIVVVFFATAIITPFAKAYTLTPVQIAQQYGYPVDERYQPEGLINMSETGQILYDYKSHTKWDPASMTKLMTMYLTLKAVKSGDLSLDDQIPITQEHYRMSTLPELSDTKLYPGETYTVAELLQIAVSASSNSAALILAKEVSGNTSDFVDLMNQTAKELNMKDTHYVNPTGAENRLLQDFVPKRYQNESAAVTTPHDYAILAQHAVQDTPKILHFTKQIAPTQHGVTYYTFNDLLEGGNMSLEGTDGLKTGSSDLADYNNSLTTKRGKFRIIHIIMGAGDYVNLGGEKQRNMMSASTINNVFQYYEYKKVLSKGVQTINGKKYYINDDLYDVVPKGFKDYHFTIERGHVHIDYDRQFINDHYGPPSVKIERPFIHDTKSVVITSWKEHPVLTTIGLGLIVVIFSMLFYSLLNSSRRH